MKQQHAFIDETEPYAVKYKQAELMAPRQQTLGTRIDASTID
ncbi:hypothetical protein [Agarivorans sp. Z349TD_8]